MNLIITRNFPPDVGGMQNLMFGLTKSLSEHMMVKVFADEHYQQEKFDEDLSFSIERVGGPKIFRKFRKASLINNYLQKNTKVKNIISDHWKSLENINTKIRKICLIHSKEINHKKDSFLNKRVVRVLNNCDHVIANSNFTKNLGIEIGVSEEKIKVINPGVFPREEVNPKIEEKILKKLEGKEPRLITVARFDKRKNHEKVIMALRNLKQKYPDIVYICIGYGDEEDNLKKLVKELDLNLQVMFFKDISDDLKNALIAKSNIFVMPSIIHKKSVEGFGIVYLEAAQYGVPSLGGKDGGASDAIDHNKTGLICDGNNLEDIYSSLDSMIENKKYIEFGRNAKEYVSKFEWKKTLENYKKIIC